MSTPPLTPPPLAAKGRPLLLWLFLGAALLAILALTLIPGFYLVEKYRGRAAWRAYETAAQARGVQLDFAASIPPEIPDAENFASIPIFDAAFRAADAKQEVPDPLKLPDAKGAELPNFSDMAKQRRIDLAEWQQYFVEAGLLPVASDNAAADVLLALEKFAAPLAQLDAASTRPHCRFPVHWELGFTTPMPQWNVVLSAAKIHALRLSAHLARGDSAAAGEEFRAGLRLATVTRAEPSLIAALVRISCALKMESAVWDGLASQRLAEPELREIEAELAQFDWLKSYVFAMGSERGCTNAMIDMAIENHTPLAELIRGCLPDRDTSSDWVFSLYPSGWHYLSKVRANRHFDEMLARFEPGQRRWFGERAIPSSPKSITDIPTKIHHLFFILAAPSLEECETKFVQAATFTDLARLACAMERCRLARGAFPQAVSELTPDFLATVPAEIVSGEPYHYRHTDDGSFVLYSVGPDLRDDGGVINPKATASKQADWVWRYPQ